MRYYFENAQSLTDGIALVCDDLGFEISEKDSADISVELCEVEKNTMSVELDAKKAKITYIS